MFLQAWVEYQYAKGGKDNKNGDVPVNMSSNGLGSSMTMAGIKEDKSGESYNNPFEMVPTTGMLFKQMSKTFVSVTASGRMTSLVKSKLDNASFNGVGCIKLSL